ncbi:MAG: ATP-binding cassette domain-containing protein [Candidatus Calditenuis sp.]|nr:ATP-binding cassette domain-containing protein [Candidatus Calditenuis sp.]MDT7968370.1 ATP-binding cassette domain-containing protein [Candidatus Calditenuis sp.]
MTELIRCEGLSKRFGETWALRDVTMVLKEGEVLGVIGPNGSGKTTLLNVISGLVRPDGGRVVIGGVDVTGKGPRAVASMGVRRTFQVPKLIGDLSVLENVALPLLGQMGLEDARRRAGEVLRRLGVERLEEGPWRLPMAERRKVELARALVSRPRVVLIDEYLSGLTEQEVEEAVNAFIDLKREMGFAAIWVEHVISGLMRAAERVLVLNEGSVLAEGIPAEVSVRKEVLEVYFGA